VVVGTSSDETREKVAKLRKEDVSFREIARRLGISDSTARRLYKQATKREATQTAPADPATANPTEETEATLRNLVTKYAAMIPDCMDRLHDAISEDRSANEIKALQTSVAIAQDKQWKAERDIATLEAAKATDAITEPDWSWEELPDNVVPMKSKSDKDETG